MMFFCASCCQALRVRGDLAEIESLLGPNSSLAAEGYHCWTDGCPGPIDTSPDGHVVKTISGDDQSGVVLIDLSPLEAYSALLGMGLPEERSCGASWVKGHLTNKTVKSVKATDIPGTTRAIVEYLEMQDGTRLYFGASSQGATVYRIVNKSPYADRI